MKTRPSNRNTLALILIAMLTFLASCGEDPAAPPAETFEMVIDRGGTYEKVTPSEEIEMVSSDEEELEDGSIMLCTVEHHSIVDAPEDYATFDPNSEVIYPGILLQGATLGGSTPEPVVVERAAGTITINLINGSEAVSAEVDVVRYSAVIQAMNDIIADNSGTLPAAFTFRSAEVQSQHQMALNMGVNFHALTADMRRNLELNSDTAYNSFLVELNQRYFTMSFDMPTSPGALFADSVTPADLARYVDADNPATYISSVTYGRRFYLLIESTESTTEMRSSIQASYDAAVAGGSSYLNGRDVNTLSNVNVKIFALGGDSSLALAAFNGNVDAVAAFLADGGGIDTGVPLSYVVRNVQDNSIVNVKVATDYEVRSCVLQQTGSFSNDFETGTEGWTGYGDFTDFSAHSSYSSIDGDFIYLRDLGNGQTCFFRAPLEYRGDWSHFYGGELSFYMIIGGPGDFSVGNDITFFDSQGNSLVKQWAFPPSSNGFLPRRVTLDETEGWLYNGQAASAEQVQQVLADVDDLFIRAEYRDEAGDWAAMDIFRVERPD